MPKDNAHHIPKTEEELLRFAISSAIVKQIIPFIQATEPQHSFNIDVTFEVNGKKYRLVIQEHGLGDKFIPHNN